MIIKTVAEHENFVNAVTVLSHAVVSTSCIPNPWKRAIVTALHRKVLLNDAGNYRTISLTCILCKVFEKLLYRHIYTHVRDNLSPHQHGFVQGKSCLSNLLETVHKINTILEDGEVVDLANLDFQKAFDKVPHERLLLKLKAHGMNGQCKNIWISSLRSWRYCVGARLKFWRRSRVPKKGNRDEAVEIPPARKPRYFE